MVSAATVPIYHKLLLLPPPQYPQFNLHLPCNAHQSLGYQ